MAESPYTLVSPLMPWNTGQVFASRCPSCNRSVNPSDDTTTFPALEFYDIVDEHVSCFSTSYLPRMLDMLYASCTRQRRP
jgi:hypothetical protein